MTAVDRFNFVQLETFYWAAKLGSFQAAANRMNTTQPGVSTRIRQLEQALGVELFDRSGRCATLTPKGRELVEDAQHLLALVGGIYQRIGDRLGLGGRVRLGVVDSIALTWLPDFFARVRTDYPKVEVELGVNLSFDLLAQLASRQIDLAIVAGPVEDPDLVVVPLREHDQGWFAAPSLVRSHEPLGLAELAELPLITHTRGSHQYQTILRWFRQAGTEPRRISTCSSLATIIRLTAAGLGISLHTSTVVARELRAGEVVPVLTTAAVPRIGYVAAYASGESSPASRVLAQLAAEVAVLHTSAGGGNGRKRVGAAGEP